MAVVVLVAEAPTAGAFLKEVHIAALTAVAASARAIPTAAIAAWGADVPCTAMVSAVRAEIRRAASAEPGVGVQPGAARLPVDGEQDRKQAQPMRRLPTVDGIRSPANVRVDVAQQARRWLGMIAFAAVGAVSAPEASAALAGVAVGDLVSVGDLDGAGDGISGVRSGSGRHIGIARGGAGTAIPALHTPMRILTEGATLVTDTWLRIHGQCGRDVWHAVQPKYWRDARKGL
jgi:hypothetical protein